MIKLKYRTGLKDMPSYDVVERDWDIKVNANESNMNLPPIIEDRLMARLASVAFNRYPNEQVELLAEQIAEVLSGWSSAISGNSSTSTGSIDIFQAAGKTITQAARKIAESISDPDTIGKQALAAATVVLVLLVLYLAAITFI